MGGHPGRARSRPLLGGAGLCASGSRGPATTTPTCLWHRDRTADLVRSHWGLENRLYRVLDNTFQEDRCRLHTGHAASNYCQPSFLFIPASSCTKSSLWFPHWTQPVRPWTIVPHHRIPACFRCAIISWLARSQSVVRACSLATMPTGSTPPNFTNTRDTPRI